MIRSIFVSLIILACFVSSCTKELEPDNSVVDNPPDSIDKPIDSIAVIRLDSIVPALARIGDTVTLFGHDFSGVTNAQIRIGNDSAEIVEITSDRIKFIVRYKFTTANINLQSETTLIEGPGIGYRYIAKVTTIAGTGVAGFQDGAGYSAAFKCPWGLAFDKEGHLLVADNYNHRLRKIDLTGPGGPYVTSTDLTSFQFYNPYNIAVDTTSNTIFITNFNTDIAKIDELGFPVEYHFPMMETTTGIAIGRDRRVYVSDNIGHKLYSMNQDGQDVQQLPQSVFTPRDVVVDQEGRLYTINSHVMEVLPDGTITHFEQEELLGGWGFAIDAYGNFVEADHANNRIQRVDRKTGKITVIAGNGLAEDIDGIGLEASFNAPMSLVFDQEGNLYVSTYNFDTKGGNKIRKITFE